MIKRMRAAAMVLAALLILTFHTVPVSAASTTITIEPDRPDAAPGETITFSVILGPVSEMGTMQMILEISDGLTYVPGSGKLADGLKQTLGYDYADFTEVSLMINGMASRADYSSDTDTLLCTFECTVDEGFTGNAGIGLTELEFYSCMTWEDHTGDFTVREAVIHISGEKEEQEAPSAEEAEETQPSEDEKEPGDVQEHSPGEEDREDNDTAPGSSLLRELHRKPRKKEYGIHRPAERVETKTGGRSE